MTIYDVVIDWQTNLPVIAEVEVEEKPKTFMVKSSTHNHAYEYMTRIPKEKAHLTPRAALDAKLSLYRLRIEALKIKLGDAEVSLEGCINLITEI